MKALTKDQNRTIRKNYKRFLSIVLMAMLGAGVFVAIRTSGSNMLYQLKSYYDDNQIFDLKISSTLGLTKEDQEAIQNLEGVEEAFGIYEMDAYLEKKDAQYVVKVSDLLKEKNQVILLEGNLPTNPDECVVDQDMMQDLSLKIGDRIQIREDMEEAEEKVLLQTSLKITGVIRSPLYVSDDKGSSSLGARKSRILSFCPTREYRFRCSNIHLRESKGN